jgi:trehalose 6-phosphate synthase/phosphatase
LALQKLCSDPNNTVYVVSGDSQQNLELAVGNVPGLGLAASNGFDVRFAALKGIVEGRCAIFHIVF